MKEIVKKIKEKDNIVIFILMFCISIGICLNIKLATGDEIWNFQNIYKMYNGFKIYEDINVIITPLFFWCAEFIFRIFGANLLVFRISHCLLMAILFLVTYKLLKKLEVPKTVSALTILMMCLQEFFLLIRTSFNYNNLALLLFVIGVYFLINEKTRKNVFIQAIITILISLTKQNIGIYYLLGSIVYVMISNQLLKEKAKEILKYSTCFLLGICIFVIYLLVDNNIYPFLNYTFGGLLEFANENINVNISGIIFMISIVAINIAISAFFLKKKYFPEKQRENIKILFIFSVVLSFVCYPIFNWAHILVGTYLMMINIVFIMYTLLKDFKDIMHKIFKGIVSVLALAMIAFSSFNLYVWIYNVTSKDYQYSWQDPFFGGLIGQEEYEKNAKVINYIETNENNVIVVSNQAALYMVPLKRNNGDFDLPFKGNFGFDGEDGLIKKIEDLENTQFLICKEDDESIYQESEKVKAYIKNTRQCIGQIEEFFIYE